MTSVEPDQKNWRLRARLQLPEPRATLSGLLERWRGPHVVGDVQSAVPHDVVVTHDDELLFVYAADERSLAAAREAVERTLREDGVAASVDVSCWDDELDEWRRLDPPPSEEQRAAGAAAERDALAPQTRTVVASVGREIRGEFEQSLRNWAAELGVECELVEQHPHLLSTQVAFTVSGPRRKVQEFIAGVRAEERASLRNEGLVITSPL